MMKWLAHNWFKAGILLILALAVALIAYYFMVFIPQRQEAQQAEQELQATFDKTAKEDCVTQAQQLAVQEYESSITCTGGYAPADCKDGSTYLVPQYNNAYTICLQGKGLQ